MYIGICGLQPKGSKPGCLFSLGNNLIAANFDACRFMYSAGIIIVSDSCHILDQGTGASRTHAHSAIEQMTTNQQTINSVSQNLLTDHPMDTSFMVVKNTSLEWHSKTYRAAVLGPSTQKQAFQAWPVVLLAWGRVQRHNLVSPVYND